MSRMKHLRTFESTEKWLNPEDVRPDMIGVNFNNGMHLTVMEIHNTADLKNKPEIYRQMLHRCEKENAGNFTSTVYRQSDLVALADGWMVLTLKHSHPSEAKILWYGSTRDFAVPATEGWKRSDALKDMNKQSGVFEGKMSDYYSYDEVRKNNKNDEDWLLPEEVFPGMIAYSTLKKDKEFKIIQMYSTEYFKNNPEVYYEMVTLWRSGGRINDNIRQISKKEAFENLKRIKKNGWWALAQHKNDPPSLESYYDKNENIDTVSIRVPATERWKTPKLSDMNNKTGVFENKAEDFLEPELVKPGMVAYWNWHEDEKKIPAGIVVEIHHTDYFKQNPEVYKKMLKLSETDHKMTDQQIFAEAQDLAPGWKVLTKRDPRQFSPVHAFAWYDNSLASNTIRVSLDEVWKESNVLKQTNNKFGVFESKEKEFLKPEDVTEGMEAEWGDDEYAGIVVGIWHSDFLKANPKIYLDCVNKTNDHTSTAKSKPGGVKNAAKGLSDGWKILIKKDTHYFFPWYTTDPKPAINEIRVAADQLWKKSKKLRDVNDDFGILENLETEYLNAEQVVAGMIGYFSPYENIIDLKAKVVEIKQIKDFTQADFLNWQEYSNSEWLTYPFEMTEVEHQPSDYVTNKNAKSFETIEEFLKLNGFDTELTSEDYLVKITSKYDISGYEIRGAHGNAIMKEVTPYNHFFQVPVSEFYKSSKQLTDTNRKTGVFENENNLEWLLPTEIIPGMIGVDFEDRSYEILEIHNVAELRKNPDNMFEFLDDNADWTYSAMREAISGKFLKNSDYLVLVKDDGVTSYNGRNILVYDEDTFRVSASELWKTFANDDLKNINKKTGFLESKTVILESFHHEEGTLNAEDVAPGMKGYDCYNGIYVDIVQCFKIADLSESGFRRLQEKSYSKWLSYRFDINSSPDGTREWYEADKELPIENVDDFLENNFFVENLTKEDYLMVVLTTKDIQGKSDYENDSTIMKFYEVLPYDPDWLEVSVKEGWKKSKKLRDANDSTGVFEKSNFNVNWDESEIAKKYLRPEEVKPGMIGLTSEANDNCEVIEMHQLKNITDDMFKRLVDDTFHGSGWFGYHYRKENNTWVSDLNKEYENVNDFITNNPFLILTQESWIAVVNTTCDFIGNCQVTPFLEVLPYDIVHFAVPVSEGWKQSDKLIDTNTKSGVFEKIQKFSNFK